VTAPAIPWLGVLACLAFAGGLVTWAVLEVDRRLLRREPDAGRSARPVPVRVVRRPRAAVPATRPAARRAAPLAPARDEPVATPRAARDRPPRAAAGDEPRFEPRAAAPEPEPARRRAVRPSAGPLVALHRASRRYVDGSGAAVDALKDVDLAVAEGELLGVIGPSGQGKSTLLNLLGGIDFPTAGEVRYRGRPLPGEESEAIRAHRARAVSFVFQELNLITHLTALDNAALPRLARGEPRERARAAAQRELDGLGIGALGHRRPAELSGGQRQRVAIARALCSEAPLILADEPTGSLDPVTARQVMEAFVERSRSAGRTVVLVTHNTELAWTYCDRVLACTSAGLVPADPAGEGERPARDGGRRIDVEVLRPGRGRDDRTPSAGGRR